MTVLTSIKNPLLLEVRRAISRGALTAGGCLVAETFHLLEEALRSGCVVQAVIAAESVRSAVERRMGDRRSVDVVVVPDTLFDKLSATESSQGVIALVKPPSWTLDQLFRGRSLVVVLDGVQDPGNAGAILRAAEAFGATGVMFLKGTVSPYNPKAVRASAGSVFRVPLAHGLDAGQTRAAIGESQLDVYAAVPSGGTPVGDIDLKRSVALIIGSEGRGVSEILCNCAREMRIPTAGVESLNAAMAAGIILYEARRQRGQDR